MQSAHLGLVSKFVTIIWESLDQYSLSFDYFFSHNQLFSQSQIMSTKKKCVSTLNVVFLCAKLGIATSRWREKRPQTRSPCVEENKSTFSQELEEPLSSYFIFSSVRYWFQASLETLAIEWLYAAETRQTPILSPLAQLSEAYFKSICCDLSIAWPRPGRCLPLDLPLSGTIMSLCSAEGYYNHCHRGAEAFAKQKCLPKGNS